MIEGEKNNAKAIELGEEYFKEKKVIGDTGYFSIENLKYLSEENIDGYIPDQQFRQRDPRFKDRGRHRPDKKTLYITEDFKYREKTDEFICPEGNILKYKHKKKVYNTSGKAYYAGKEDCRQCTRRKKCLLKEDTKYRTIYLIDEYSGRNYVEEMKAKIDKPEGRDIYSRRMGIIEPVFGNIRNSKRLNRFTLRTKNKVNIQWTLFCIIHNIEKIFKYGNIGKLIKV
jgi:hypothetical protein